MYRKTPKINWKKVLIVSVGPFIPLWIFWLIINPPWWARSSPAYTLWRLRNPDFTGIHMDVPPKPSTRPMALFQIYPPGSKYSTLYAYDHVAKNKVEYGLYGIPRSPKEDIPSLKQDYQDKFDLYFNNLDFSSPTLAYFDENTKNSVIHVFKALEYSAELRVIYQKDIYLYQNSTDSYRKLYTTTNFGKCTNAFYWDQAKHEVYAESVYTVGSGEEYVKEYCIIDDTTGAILTTFLQPNYDSKKISYGNFDEVSKRKIAYDFNEVPGAYLVDFPERRITYIDINETMGYRPNNQSFRDGKIVLMPVSLGGYFIYDVRAKKATSLIAFPEGSMPLSTRAEFRSLSPSGAYLMFYQHDPQTKNICYVITDYQTNMNATHFCHSDLDNLDHHIEFAGWEE